MRRIHLAVCALALSVPGYAWGQQATLLGIIASRDTLAVPPAAVVEITLEDVSHPDRPPVTITSATIRRPGSLPITFSLEYDSAAIRTAGRYALRARVRDGEVILFDGGPTPVLTQGRGSVANLTLRRSEPAAPAPVAETAVARQPSALEQPSRKAPSPPAARVSRPPAEKRVGPPPTAKPKPKPAPTKPPVPAKAVQASVVAAPPEKQPPVKSRPVAASERPARAPVTPPPAVKPVSTVVPSPPPATSAGISELPATFTGTLPCADCPGIRYHLNLMPDQSYLLRRTRLGAPGEASHEAGTFGFSSDGAVLILRGGEQSFLYFAVKVAGVLRAVDRQADSVGLRTPQDLHRSNSFEPIDAPAATPYLAPFITLPLSGPSWRLVEMQGEAVRPSGEDWRETTIVFDSAAGTFRGESGCNSFTGKHSAEGRTLTLAPASRLRPCLAFQGEERALARAIENTRRYRITGTVLDLFDAGGTRLARFEGRAR